MDQALMDLIQTAGGNVSAIGDVATRLLASNFNVNSLRTCRVLRKDEWILFDRTVVDIARERLQAVEVLQSRGLTMQLPNALGTTRIEWERISDITGAEISMSGVKESEADRPVFDLVSMPVPIIHKDFHINIRALETSRRFGTPLDTTMAALATRKVAEMIEYILFNGVTVAATNGTIYGFLNAPNANTGSLRTTGWDTVGTTGAEVIADVLEMIAALQGDNMFGPYGIWVPQGYWSMLVDDYKANSDRTVLERILAIPDISFVRPTKSITNDTVIMFQLTPDVVRLVEGMQPTLLEWESHGGMVTNFKVMAIILPQFRNDILSQSGVAKWTA